MRTVCAIATGCRMQQGYGQRAVPECAHRQSSMCAQDKSAHRTALHMRVTISSMRVLRACRALCASLRCFAPRTGVFNGACRNGCTDELEQCYSSVFYQVFVVSFVRQRQEDVRPEVAHQGHVSPCWNLSQAVTTLQATLWLFMPRSQLH